MKKIRMTILKDYETCPYMCKINWGEEGALGKVDKEGSSTNKYAEFGVIFHEVMEQHALAKMEGTVLPVEALHQLLEDKLKTFDMELVKDEQEFEDWRISLHEQIDWGYEKAGLAYFNVIGAEVTFDQVELFPGVLPFSGTIDRIVGDLEKKEVALEDWKTGKVYTKKELSSNIQATVYALAFYKQFGFLPEEFRFYFTKHKKVKKIMITPEFIQKGTERILLNWYKIHNGEFNPNTSNKYFCKNFCAVAKECPTQKRVKVEGWDMVK